MSNKNVWWEEEDIKLPRHFIIIDTGKAVLIYGRQGMKCNSIHGDYIVGSLALPTINQLNFIHNASGCKALTDDEKQLLALSRVGSIS